VYELFVLGELRDRPSHGYELHRIIQEVIGPVRRLSWGALYPLLRRLERAGLIAREADGEGSRERKRYRITAAGEARFRDLMLAPGPFDANYPDLFTLKLGNFHAIDGAARLAILRHYRGYVEFILDYLRNSLRHVASEPAILDAERPHILRGLDHRLHLAQADLHWLDAEIARLDEGMAT
jgi:DNA-binding PadR family transcriptional regulator